MISLKSKIALIGAGKISYSLVSSLKKSGFYVTAIISRKKSSAKKLAEKFNIDVYTDRLDDIPVDCKIFFLTVPDAELKTLAGKLSKLKLDFSNLIFIHLSGAEDISVLSSLKRLSAATASIHIMQSFPSKEIVNISNCSAAVETDIKSAEKFLFDLAFKLKLKPFKIDSSSKVFYHLAGVYSSNFLVANLFNTKELFLKTKTRISFENVYSVIINSTLNNIYRLGVEDAISGPVERADLKTIKKHLKSLNFNKTIKKNYISQSLILLDLIEKRDGKLSSKHSKLKFYLKSSL